MAKKDVPSAVRADDEKWRAESDARTLVEAENIRGDRKRLKAALAEVRKQREALSKVANDGGK